MQAKLLRATLLGKGSDTGNARSLPTPGGALSQSVSGAHGTAQGSIRAALAWEEDDEALLAAIPTDTELAVIALTGQFHASLSAANLPMLALRSHLYIQWGRTDRTELDRELDDLRRTNTLRVFQLTLGKHARHDAGCIASA